MVAVKGKLLHSINSLIVLMISLLGFTTSCQDDEPVLMYGSPHATFIISGKVTSAADNQPIKDIIVEIREAFEQEGNRLTATGFSYGQGDYSVDADGYPHDKTFQVRFVDTDGLQNGEYEPLDTTIVFKDPKFIKGDGSWYYGYTEKTLDVKLKPKE